MKYIVCSDIHGNILALNSLLQLIDNNHISGVICCGDICGYYYHADEVLNILSDMENLLAVRGNHDDNFLKILSGDGIKENYVYKYGNAYSILPSESNMAYLSSLPTSISTIINHKRVGIFHGSPLDELNGRIYPDTSISENDAPLFNKYDVVFLGHTHYQMVQHINNTLIINPGSLGQPRDGKGFSYCLIDFRTNDYQFGRILDDYQEIIDEINSFETKEHHRNYLRSVLERKQE